MSKYLRTRKAICRISHLSKWIVSRDYFRRHPSETWKQSYKKKRKKYLKYCNYLPTGYSYIKGKQIPFPCKYSDARKHFTLWKVL